MEGDTHEKGWSWKVLVAVAGTSTSGVASSITESAPRPELISSIMGHLARR